MAGPDGPVRGGAGPPVLVRGDLLLPGSDLRGRVPVWMAAAIAVGALVERYADRRGRGAGRPVSGRGELMDELTGRIHAAQRHDHPCRPGVGVFQLLDPV